MEPSLYFMVASIPWSPGRGILWKQVCTTWQLLHLRVQVEECYGSKSALHGSYYTWESRQRIPIDPSLYCMAATNLGIQVEESYRSKSVLHGPGSPGRGILQIQDCTAQQLLYLLVQVGETYGSNSILHGSYYTQKSRFRNPMDPSL